MVNNTCPDVTDVTSQQHTTVGSSPINLKRINELTKKIDNLTNCNSIKLLIGISNNEINDLSKDLQKEATNIIASFLGISKPPAPNPVAIAKWATKVSTGQAGIQLQAAIKLFMQITQYISATEKLLVSISTAQEKLTQCAQNTINSVPQQFSNMIKQTQHNVEQNIIKGIEKNLCSSSTAMGIETDIQDLYKAVNAAKALMIQTNSALTQVQSTLVSTLTSAQTAHDSIVSAANVTSTMDFSSTAALANSISNGSFSTLQSTVSTALTAPAPINEIPPNITGTAIVGQTLTTDNGTWDNTYNLVYQWQANGVAISSATTNTLLLDVSLRESIISCEVIAETTFNATVATSNNTSPVIMPPISLTLPTITGTTVHGNTLTATSGSWYSTTISSAPQYQWLSNGINISGANTSTFLLTSTQIGAAISVSVAVTNVDGQTVATSNPTATIT